MFEAAELDSAIDKKSYERELPEVRAALLAAQRTLASSKHSCLILIGGDAAAGKGELIDTLLAWMDARGLQVSTFLSRSPEEKQRPRWWRFWRAMPAAGRASIFFGSWYTRPLDRHAHGTISEAELDGELRRIVELERMLAAEKVLVVKLWLHLTRKTQKKHIEKLRRDPLGRTQLTARELDDAAHYADFQGSAEHILRMTSTAESPWLIVNSAHPRHRNLAAARALTDAITRATRRDPAVSDKSHKPPPLPVLAPKNLLSELDLSRKLSDAEAARKLDHLQVRLALATRALSKSRRSAILLFEGPDAAGKGGAIRRVTAPIDARIYQVKSVAAPGDEERAHPYLWRFWRDLPRRGHMTIYDRSWYGRVLVERLEGFAAPEEWQRAYGEINAFEDQLIESGAILLKFWIAISPEEQLRRFKDRKETPYKQFKLTAEDWRNRHKWDGYSAAACDMFEKTSTEQAKWHLIAGDDKKWARVQVLKRVVRALEKAIDE